MESLKMMRGTSLSIISSEAITQSENISGYQHQKDIEQNMSDHFWRIKGFKLESPKMLMW